MFGRQTYQPFLNLLPAFYKSPRTAGDKLDGLKVFPDDHRWKDFIENVQKERTRLINDKRAR
jgi:hypothetical protein